MWWIMIGTVAAVHAKVRRSVAPKRPGVGASSRRRNSMSETAIPRSDEGAAGTLMRSAFCSRAGASLADRHHGRGAEAKRLVRIVHFEPHREPCGQAYP